MNNFKNAKGAIPWNNGDELPEDAIARARGHLPAWEKAVGCLYADLARVTEEQDRLREEIVDYKELLIWLDRTGLISLDLLQEKFPVATKALKESEE